MNKNILRLVTPIRPSHKGFINQYKRHDVFRCAHDAHHRFHNMVSVYHVLKEKKCYPQGCIYFRWRCKKLNKGETCSKKYKHVGRNCFGCRHFYDIKEMNRPEVLLSEENFNTFKDDLRQFEGWLSGLKNSQIEFSGEISAVKPRYILKMGKHAHRILLNGFLLTFSSGFINTTHLNDYIYIPVSSRTQNRYGFAKGDKINLWGCLTEKKGIMLLNQIRRIEREEKGLNAFWTESRARVAQHTGTIFFSQIEKCYSCEKGVLLPVEYDDSQKNHFSRALFCLEGIASPDGCCYAVTNKLHLSQCYGDEEHYYTI